MAFFFDFLLVFDCRYSLQQYWCTWLQFDVSPLPLVFSVYGLSAMGVFLLNCIAAVPTVFCVCNAWLWGQLSFQMRVRSLGRWLEVSIRVVEDVVSMRLRMLLPGGFVGCRNTFSTVFWMRRTVLGTAVQSLRSSLIVILRDAFVFARSCTSDQLCRVQKNSKNSNFCQKLKNLKTEKTKNSKTKNFSKKKKTYQKNNFQKLRKLQKLVN